MNLTGGYCLPDFAKKDINIWFATDKIDLTVDVYSGKGSFNETLLVMNQRALSGEFLNQPLQIKSKLEKSPSVRNYFIQSPIVRKTAIKHPSFVTDIEINLSSYSLIWYLCSFLTSSPTLSMFDSAPSEHKGQNEPSMPTWAGTKSLNVKIRYSKAS